MSEDAERIVQEPLVTGEPPRTILEPTHGIAPIAQYSLGKILLVWAAAAIPITHSRLRLEALVGQCWHTPVPHQQSNTDQQMSFRNR